MAKTQRVKFEFNEHSLVSLERLKEQGAFVMSNESDCSTGLASVIGNAIKKAGQYMNCMSVHVSRRGSFVELLTDNSRRTYSETIPGIVGGDCGLIRDMETDEVIGIKLELKTDRLVVHHDGPMRINTGFLKTDVP